MANKDGIQKYDIISKGALDTWEDFVRLAKEAHTELLEIIKAGPGLNQELSKAEWAKELSASVKDVVTNIEQLIKVEKQLKTINDKLLGGEEKAIAEKKKEIELRRQAKEAQKRETEEKRKAINAAKEQERVEKAAARAAAKAAKEKIRYAQQVAKEAAKANAATKKFTAELETHANKSRKAASNNNSLGTSFIGLSKSIGHAILAYTGIGAAINLVMNTFSSIIDVTKKLDSLGFSIKTIITDTFELAQTQNYLSDIIQNYGTDLVDTTNAYIKFRAAVGTSNISVKEGQQIFNSMSKASAVLGLTQEKTNLVYLALEQMLSKGLISSEELRRQMGEQMPVAMQAMAKAFQIATKQGDGSVATLLKFMKQGKVISDEVLPEFARQVEKALGIESVTKVNTLVAAQERLNTSWANFVEILKAAKPLITAYNSLSGALQNITKTITPDETIVSKRSTNLLTETMQKLEGITDVEERRKILLESYTQLQNKQLELNKTINESEKSRPNGFLVGLSKLNRGAGLGKTFTSAADFEDVYKDTVLDADAYAKAVAEIRNNFEKLAALPPVKEIINFGDEDGRDTFNDELSKFKNLQDAKLSAYIEHLENMRKIAYDKIVESGVDEIEIESATNGLKMDLDTDVFNFKLGLLDELLNYVKSHGEDISAVEKEIADVKADYAKKSTDFTISENERFHKNFLDNAQEEIRKLQDLKDAQLAMIEARMQMGLLNLQNDALSQGTKAKQSYQFDLIDTALQKESLRVIIAGYEEMLSIEQLSADESKSIAKNLFDAKKNFLELERDEVKKTLEDRKAAEAAAIDFFAQSINQMADMFSEYQNTRAEQLQWNYERDVNLAGDNLDKKLALEEQYNKEKRKLERRQAILNKAQSAFNIIINTWQGVASALSSVATIPLVPFIKLMGALSLAATLAAPLPKYEFGGEHEGGLARFSEKGSELFIPKSGKPFLTPITETIADMPAGKFIPHDETQKILAQHAMNNFVNEASDVDLTITNNLLTKIANKNEIIYANGFLITNKNNIFGRYVSRR